MKESQTDKIHIQTDPELRPLLPKYLESRKRDLVNLKKAFEDSNFTFIEKTSHTIKGHGSSYGFVRLTEICKLLEQAALDKDLKLINFLLQEYADYISRVELT